MRKRQPKRWELARLRWTARGLRIVQEIGKRYERATPGSHRRTLYWCALGMSFALLNLFIGAK